MCIYAETNLKHSAQEKVNSSKYDRTSLVNTNQLQNKDSVHQFNQEKQGKIVPTINVQV